MKTLFIELELYYCKKNLKTIKNYCLNYLFFVVKYHFF